jgi:hypothetical protein
MSTAARPIRCLDKPGGPYVEILAIGRDGYVKVRSLRTGTTFETLATRLHRPT